ncbi:ABC transporter substrate-binding protein [Pseudodesulfovibrio pelocollis]|uniref:ABC transporter substrate-binding protein n=1 Tax=Pseudodesulfovibrio pelocollis TaxID=3051432 RepID=UPI00255AD0B8|nr:ABC transporter substrate-binding protein [Pseudodesulfovibrio sp. SB368]
MKRLLPLLFLFFFLAACADNETERSGAEKPRGAVAFDPAAADWGQLVEAARGTTVRFYMYGGFAHTNRWIDGWVAPRVSERFGITLVREPMDAPVFVNKLVTERQAGRTSGSIDLLWVNGENFKSLKEADALHGPFAQRLPNVMTWVNPEHAATDFGTPVEGYEAPFGQAQFVFEYDSARTDPPGNYRELLEWVRDNPGQFTYPQPPDFTGSAFIRQAFYAVTGGHEQYLDGFDPALFARNAPLLWAYLNELNPHLWQQGKTYPKSSAELDTLLARGEVGMGMSYHPLHAQSMILDGSYPPTIRTFLMDEGTIFNLHFTAIPFNAGNVAGAMVLADFLLSPEAQLSKFRPENWGDFPAIDLTRLAPATRAEFEAVNLGAASLSPSVLTGSAVPEVDVAYLEALERGWEEHVLRAKP